MPAASCDAPRRHARSCRWRRGPGSLPATTGSWTRGDDAFRAWKAKKTSLALRTARADHSPRDPSAAERQGTMKIVEIREKTIPISSPIRNAYIDFSKMTLSLVAVITDVVRDGERVVGYGFNSNGRYGQGALMRERFIPRLLEADPKSLLDKRGVLSPERIWATMMTNEKPGGHGERSV